MCDRVRGRDRCIKRSSEGFFEATIDGERDIHRVIAEVKLNLDIRGATSTIEAVEQLGDAFEAGRGDRSFDTLGFLYPLLVASGVFDLSVCYQAAPLDFNREGSAVFSHSVMSDLKHSCCVHRDSFLLVDHRLKSGAERKLGDGIRRSSAG